VKITRRQLRRLIREQFRSRQSTYEAPRREFDEGQKLPLKDKGTGISSGEGMEREMVIETMKLIQKWRNLTRKHDLTDRHGEATFDSYVDSAFKTVQGKIYNNDYSVPYDLPGLSEMKINKTDLKRIIKEEISRLSEVRRSPVDPEGDDYEGGENRGLAAIEYTLPPPTKPPAWWRPGQRVSWNKLAASREHGHLAVPDNYEFFLKAHDKLLADYLKDSNDPNEMAIIMTLALEAQAREAQALEAKAREAQDLGPSASQPATTGFPDLDAKLRRGRGSGHVDLSQLSESRIDLGRWNKMAGTLLCEADYHDFGIPVPAEELRPQSKKLMPLDTALYSGTSADKYGEDPSWSTDPYGEEEDVQATHFSDHPGNLSFLNWAKKVLDASYPDISKISPEMTRQEIDRHLHQIGNSVLHGIAVDAWREGVFPEDYASDMEVLPLPPERGVTV